VRIFFPRYMEERKEGGREGGREGFTTYIWVGVKHKLEVLEEDVHDEEHGREDD